MILGYGVHSTRMARSRVSEGRRIHAVWTRLRSQTQRPEPQGTRGSALPFNGVLCSPYCSCFSTCSASAEPLLSVSSNNRSAECSRRKTVRMLSGTMNQRRTRRKIPAMQTTGSSSGRGMGRMARTMRPGAPRKAGRAMPTGRPTDLRDAPSLGRIPAMPDSTLARPRGWSWGTFLGG